MKKIILVLALVIPFVTLAQKPKVYNVRPYDKKGINQFETPKIESEFDGIKVAVGAGFTQQFQSLKHKNTSSVDLYRLDPGFGLAQANLYLDAQLADGILLNLTTYLSSKHHNEAWVKGGFLQIDKIPFQGKIWEELSKIITIKAGHFEVNYGDAHFRRNDGGHTIYNPFVENYIMDAFSTEIAGEVYAQKNGFVGMIGVSNGLLQGGHQSPLVAGTTTNETYKRSPSIYAKLAYDKKVTEDLRVRLAGSVYHNSSSGRSTLYAGDRTGSQYYMAMAPAVTSGAASTPANNYATGRLSPNFTNQITAVQFNGFAKYKGLEFFGTLETSKGKLHAEKEYRNANQYAADLVYRFGKDENLFVGARYNKVKGEFLTNSTIDQSSERTAFAAGWFILPSVMMKAEIMSQTYTDFPHENVLSGGKFNGFVMQAIVGF